MYVSELISFGQELGLLNKHDIKMLQTPNATKRLIYCYERKWFDLVHYLFTTVYSEIDVSTDALICKACIKAFNYGYLELITMIFKYFGEGKKNTIFQHACSNGNIQFAKYLVSIGVDIHSDDDWAYRVACIFQRFNCMKYLIDIGIGIVFDEVKNKALISCCQVSNCIDSINYLLENGADVNFENNKPIRTAVQYHRLEYVDMLLKHGASLDLDGLIICILHTKIINLLLDNNFMFVSVDVDKYQIKKSQVDNFKLRVIKEYVSLMEKDSDGLYKYSAIKALILYNDAIQKL
jgi:hypothetical protein